DTFLNVDSFGIGHPITFLRIIWLHSPSFFTDTLANIESDSWIWGQHSCDTDNMRFDYDLIVM
ncbi:hypothetical protein, partial [Acinetobacter baumannii]|uniref:hypothetical protein n=1 Tax=Acinetobacter baumannii TaxID=470 RepID=UPI001C07D119